MPLFDYDRGDSDRGPSYEGVDAEDRVDNGPVPKASSAANQGLSPRLSICTRSCNGISVSSIFYISVTAILLIATSVYLSIRVPQLTADEPASAQTFSPTREQQIQEQVWTVTSEQALADPQTSQYQAYHWILTQDPREVSGDNPDLLQRYALATLYFSTSGKSRSATSWINSKNWLTAMHECSWYGIKCVDFVVIQNATDNFHFDIPQLSDFPLPTPESKGVVVAINLTSTGLVGSLPQQIVALKYLLELYLGSNQLSGKLHNSWGNLTHLGKLVLNRNNFSGVIPASLAMFTNLTLLDLGYNDFTGTFPQEICDKLKLESYGDDLKISLPQLIDCGCACAENTTNPSSFAGLENASDTTSISPSFNQTSAPMPPDQNLIAQIKSFPSSTSLLDPSGDVVVYFGDDIKINLNVGGFTTLCIPYTTNGCGIHIHEGTSCDNSDQVMGHYWSISVLGESDPWVNVTYNTNTAGFSGGSVVLMNGNGYSMEENDGHAIVIHDQNGKKIACGILAKAAVLSGSENANDTTSVSPSFNQTSIPMLPNQNLMNGTSMLISSAQIRPFSSSNLSLDLKGNVVVYFSDDIKISLNVSGLESVCVPANANGCGIHIHEGTSCDNSDQVMGHYWSISVLGELDPWVNVTYNTNTAGFSGGSVVLMNGNGYSMEENDGHAIVIHDQNGKKIACGILAKAAVLPGSENANDTTSVSPSFNQTSIPNLPNQNLMNGTSMLISSALIRPFSSSNLSLDLKGNVVVDFSDDIKISLNVSGLESVCVPANANGCGIHIHEGTSCDNINKVMGHYWSSSVLGESDPWVNVTYNTITAGFSGGSIVLVGGNGYSMEENDGHAIIIHDQNGEKIACGILVASKSKDGL